MEIPVKYLKKQKGARLHDIVTTFQSVCTPEDANVKLHVSPEQDVYYILKSAVENQDVVIKVQDIGKTLFSELTIHDRLRDGCNNIVRYICNFNCLLDIIWYKPLEKPLYVCDNDGKMKHILVMEYINNDLAKYLERMDIENEIFCSIVKQAGFAMLDFHINKFVCHGGINRGNILLHIDNNMKDLTYTINGQKLVVNTLGYEIIYTDFQRGRILDSCCSTKINTILVRDELSLLYELMSRWTINNDYKVRLQELMKSIMMSKTVEEMVMYINAC